MTRAAGPSLYFLLIENGARPIKEMFALSLSHPRCLKITYPHYCVFPVLFVLW